MKNIFVEGICGLISSIIGFAVFSGLETLMQIDFGGDKSVIFVGLFFGLPLGSIFGVLLAKKILFKENTPFIFRTIMSLILAGGGVIFGIYLLDVLGGQFVFLIPLIGIFLVEFGYHAKLKRV